MIKRNPLIILFVVCCAGVMFFMLASLGTYEDHYSDQSGAWYSKDSMKPYQYAAYLLTYLVSFPLGTLLSLYDVGFLANKWLVVCIPNFIIYFYVVKMIGSGFKRKPGLRP